MNEGRPELLTAQDDALLVAVCLYHSLSVCGVGDGCNLDSQNDAFSAF
jgi:hypothetical protein